MPFYNFLKATVDNQNIASSITISQLFFTCLTTVANGARSLKTAMGKPRNSSAHLRDRGSARYFSDGDTSFAFARKGNLIYLTCTDYSDTVEAQFRFKKPKSWRVGENLTDITFELVYARGTDDDIGDFVEHLADAWLNAERES